MPKKALSHIQKMAPGPPEAIAVAAPAMFPVPTCAATAVASDWNELMPSFPALSPCRRILPKTALRPCRNLRTWTNFSRMVNQIPVPHRSTSKIASHIQVFTVLTKEVSPFMKSAAPFIHLPPFIMVNHKSVVRFSIAKRIENCNHFQIFLEKFHRTPKRRQKMNRELSELQKGRGKAQKNRPPGRRGRKLYRRKAGPMRRSAGGTVPSDGRKGRGSQGSAPARPENISGCASRGSPTHRPSSGSTAKACSIPCSGQR